MDSRFRSGLDPARGRKIASPLRSSQ